jgi:hypothetical protein
MAASEASVRIQSDPIQKVQPTAPTKKACKCRPFPKRLMGFEPTTFCMAIRSSTPEIALKCL